MSVYLGLALKQAPMYIIYIYTHIQLKVNKYIYIYICTHAGEARFRGGGFKMHEAFQVSSLQTVEAFTFLCLRRNQSGHICLPT